MYLDAYPEYLTVEGYASLIRPFMRLVCASSTITPTHYSSVLKVRIVMKTGISETRQEVPETKLRHKRIFKCITSPSFLKSTDMYTRIIS